MQHQSTVSAPSPSGRGHSASNYSTTTETIRSWSTQTDQIGFTYTQGALQLVDLRSTLSKFQHKVFIKWVFDNYQNIWINDAMKVVQVQCADRLFGTVIMDSSNNLIRYCVETDLPRLVSGNRKVISDFMRTWCTQVSVTNYRH